MIRIHVVSDLHDDIEGNEIKDWTAVEADLNVVAGDGRPTGSHALRLLRWMYPDTSIPLIYVAGNHDFYSESNPKLLAVDPTLKTTWENERIRMREVACELGIIFLDDDVAVMDVAGDPVRVIGSTLWSSFQARPPFQMFGDAVLEAKQRMRDYSYIKTGRGRGRDKLRPGDTIDAHKRSVAFIEQTLSEPFDGQTIVATHHLPTYRSLQGWDPENPRKFQPLDYCYASDLEYLMTGGKTSCEQQLDIVPPAIWIHGHVHANQDYVVGDTRIVANPRGYPDPKGPGGRENPDFDPTLVIELEPKPRLGWKP